MCPHGTFAAAHCLSDLGDRHILIVSKDKRRPLFSADCLQSIAYTLLDKCAIGLAISAALSRRRRLCTNSTAADTVPAPDQLAVVIYRRVGRDSIQPGNKRLLTAKPTKLAKHLQPYFLDAIGHLRRIQDNPVADAMNPVDMAAIQRGRGVSVAPFNCLNQGFVWPRVLSIHHSDNTYELLNENEYKKIDLFFG
jgi:hypothetical protein